MGAAGGEDRGAWVQKGPDSVVVDRKQGEVQEGSEEEEKQIQELKFSFHFPAPEGFHEETIQDGTTVSRDTRLVKAAPAL